MSLTPYNTNILQALKWQQNKAPRITSLITQKHDWYVKYNDKFWADWYTNVFDLRTANGFGVYIWCVILGVPAQLFGLFGNSRGFAYGPKRQNYVYSGTSPSETSNTIGGNFAGGSDTTVLNLAEARLALRLRYAALVSNGRIEFVNYMLKYIFNDGEDWDFAGGKYFYVADLTIVAATSPIKVSEISSPFKIEYRIGPKMDFSDQFINVLNTPEFGITPQFAGSSYKVVVES